MKLTNAERIGEILKLGYHHFMDMNLQTYMGDGDAPNVIREAERSTDSPSMEKLIAVIGQLYEKVELLEMENELHGIMLGTLLGDAGNRDALKSLLLKESGLSDLDKATILGHIDKIGE